MRYLLFVGKTEISGMLSQTAKYERHDEDPGEDNTFHGERFQGSCTLKRLRTSVTATARMILKTEKDFAIVC